MRETFEFRLYPNRHQRELLMTCLIESRHLYNEMLQTVKDHYAESGEFLFKYELTIRFKGRSGEHVPATTVQTLAGRLDKALQRFVARKKHKERVGFPRFKSPNRWHSIILRQWGKDVRLEEKEFLHKSARRYVEAYRTIVVEDLNVASMVKNRYLAKSIADASWSKRLRQ